MIISEVDPEPIPGFILRIKKSALLFARMHFEPRKGHAVSKATAMEFILSSGRRIALLPEDEVFGGLAMILHWNKIKVESKDPSFKLRFFIPQSLSDSINGQKMPGLDRVNLLISKKTKYLIARTVAKGGFGKLHTALDLKSKQIRAVKIFSTYKKTVSKTSKESLNLELNMQKRFQPKIRLYDEFRISSPSHDHEGSPLTKFYVVMDMFACSLRSIIEMLPPEKEVFNPKSRKSRWTVARLTAKEIFELKHYIFSEIVKDIQKLHNQDYRHGDIKDPNVLIFYDGIPALADYGSVRKDPEQTTGTAGWYFNATSGKGFGGDIGALALLFLRINWLLAVKSFTTYMPCTYTAFSNLDFYLNKQKKSLHSTRVNQFANQLQGVLSSKKKTIITSDSFILVKGVKDTVTTLLEYKSMLKTTTIYESLSRKGISDEYKKAHEELARYLFSEHVYKENVRIGKMVELVKNVRKHINVSKSKDALAKLAKSTAVDPAKYRKALSDAGRLVSN